MAYKSRYKPKFPEKYRGEVNNIICRSSWERKFCKFLDLNTSVIQWSSEPFPIPYFSEADNRWRRYWPDFWIKYRNKTGDIVQKIVEIKPRCQTTPPRKNKRHPRKYLNEMKTYITNQCKWEAAREFCRKNGLEFVVLTEDDLGIRK